MFITVEDDAIVTSRTFEATATKKARTVHKQRAYMHTGKKFPTEIQIPVDTSMGLELGEYQMLDASYQVGKYGDIQINPFELALTMTKDSSGKKLQSV
jgi:uncharacterized protein affecting Mg2+/Co2+ transport